MVGLSSEVAELKSIFVDGNSQGLTDHTDSGSNHTDITDATSMEPPTITGMTLEISHLHQKILKWKADQDSQLSKACQDVKQAQDERKFAIQESELKIKQLHEKCGNLMKGVSDGANAKVQELSLKLSTADKALSEREAEIKTLQNEVKVSVASSQEAQKSAIELEKKLAASEKKQTELASAREQLDGQLKIKEDMVGELKAKLSELKQKCGKLESQETETSKLVAVLQGGLKAKEEVLQRVQESFEKLNGRVFSTSEEMESELKCQLLDRERGLENQSAENKKLETNIVEIQQQKRELSNKLAELNGTIEGLENANQEAQLIIQDLQHQLGSQEMKHENFLSQLLEALQVKKDFDQEDGHITKDFGKVLKVL